jgi:hypothetical protein
MADSPGSLETVKSVPGGDSSGTASILGGLKEQDNSAGIDVIREIIFISLIRLK